MTYQGGDKEGQPLDEQAVALAHKLLGYNNTDSHWSNYHDVAVEALSDAIITFREFCKRSL